MRLSAKAVDAAVKRTQQASSAEENRMVHRSMMDTTHG